ncbi:hypothetical protein BH23GEM8_BH23GEM8_18540 [soil metagenome]
MARTTLISARLTLSLAVSVAVAACAGTMPGTRAAPAGWAAMADTTLCVVDRTAPSGLRNLAAKIDASGRVMVLSSNRIQTLDEVHPVSLLAGYAGSEPWMSGAATPVRHADRRFIRAGGERRVPIELIARVGDYQGVPLFASPAERPAEAVYVPLRPGCVFQAYIREDLM